MKSQNMIQRLEKAKYLYGQLRLREAYREFRRCFDKLPLTITAVDLSYMGMFVRTLWELDKQEELEFYSRALEKWHAQAPSVELTYALAVAYLGGTIDRHRRCRELLEDVIRKSPPGNLRARAKMLLANVLSTRDLEEGTVRTLVESLFDEPLDEELEILAEIWLTLMFFDEGKKTLAFIRLQNLVTAVATEDLWYASFSCRYHSADLLQREGLQEQANQILSELKGMYQDKPVATIHRRVRALEQRLIELDPQHHLTLEGPKLTYRQRSLELDPHGSLSRLLEAFVSKQEMNKEELTLTLQGRPYQGKGDDERIYSSIHRLRKKLMELGLPGHTIQGCRKRGYRLQLQIMRNQCETASSP